MSAVAGLTAFILAGLAGLHVYWGIGGVWPGTDEKSCARAVAGFRGIERMPSSAVAFAVAAALLAAAIIALALASVIAVPLPFLPLALAGIGIGLAFLGRGIAGFTPVWRRLTPEMPFARNDRRWFSPLCLLIGTGFVLLVSQGTTA